MRKERKNLKYGIIALFSLMLLVPSSVSASNAVVNRYGSGAEIPNIKRIDRNGEDGKYIDNSFKVTYKGANFEAYCIDPGLHLRDGGNTPLTCSDDNLDDRQRGALMWLYTHQSEIHAPFSSSSAYSTHFTFQEALRYVSKRYLNLVKSNTNSEPYGYSISENQKLSQLRTIASRSINNGSYSAPNGNTGATGTTSATLYLDNPIKNDDGSFSVHVNTSLSLDSINFTCNECSSVEKDAGTSTVKVVLNPNECSFTLNASAQTANGDIQRYNRRRPVLCTSNGNSYQDMIIFTDVAFEDVPQASITYRDTSCGPETPEEPEEPNRCTEQTRMTAPEYCDDPDAENEYISITAPTNVRYCILGGEDDAGNSYEMLDEQVDADNPYCSVYCKEDYQIKMPGAQYTTSGQFFSLQNTVVTATRSCYTDEIKIDQYVNDIKAAQEALINAQNAYNKAKKERELAAATNGRSNDTENCNGDHGTTYTSGTGTYTKYSLGGYDSRTGVYTVNAGTANTDSHTWGTDYNTSFVDGRCRDDGTSVVSDPTIGNLQSAETALTNAKNAYNAVLKHINQCYNWNNNLCTNTEVSFDYNEQYNTDINYELVSRDNRTTETTYATTINNEYNNTVAVSNLEKPAYVKCDDNGCRNEAIGFGISTLNTKYYYRKVVTTEEDNYNNSQSFATNYPSGLIDTVTDRSQLRYNYSYLGAVFPIALNTTRGVYQWDLNFTNLGQYNDNECRNGRLNQVLDSLEITAGAGVDYVCVYVVNCPDCDYECVGEGCLIPDEPSCPECDFYCVDCIFDGYSTSFYRLISVDNVNPENRTMGANWTTEKGERTKQEIEQNGDSVYINPVAEFKLTPEDMKRIRDYNRDKDTYVAEDLEFHSLNGVANAYGTSKFIDDGEENGYFTLIKRPSSDSWVLWDGTGDNVGPAWKVG